MNDYLDQFIQFLRSEKYYSPLESPATAILSGGELKLEWQGGANPVMMTGDTAMVYRGEIEYE